jgi:hypothetical protein
VGRFSTPAAMAGMSALGACGMMDPAKAAAAGIQFPMSQRRKRRVLFTQVEISFSKCTILRCVFSATSLCA